MCRQPAGATGACPRRDMPRLAGTVPSLGQVTPRRDGMPPEAPTEDNWHRSPRAAGDELARLRPDSCQPGRVVEYAKRDQLRPVRTLTGITVAEPDSGRREPHGGLATPRYSRQPARSRSGAEPGPATSAGGRVLPGPRAALR